MPYDVNKDFAYIGMMAKSPMLLVVHPSMPVKSLKELVALARKRPGELNYGSSGTGGSNHLTTELFAKLAGISKSKAAEIRHRVDFISVLRCF